MSGSSLCTTSTTMITRKLYQLGQRLVLKGNTGLVKGTQQSGVGGGIGGTGGLKQINKGGTGGQSFWSEGTKKPEGLIFGETPPPPGQTRKWESWEAPWYGTLTLSFILLAVGLSSKPDNGITTWARDEAMKRRYPSSEK